LNHTGGQNRLYGKTQKNIVVVRPGLYTDFGIWIWIWIVSRMIPYSDSWCRFFFGQIWIAIWMEIWMKQAPSPEVEDSMCLCVCDAQCISTVLCSHKHVRKVVLFCAFLPWRWMSGHGRHSE
jgi:hypothetical protein